MNARHHFIGRFHLRRTRAGLFALLLVGPLLTPPAATWATVVQPVTLSELTARSTHIVHGTVLETATRWEDDHSRLYTYVTVTSQEFLKGGPPGGRSITFRQLGGRDGDQILYVPGTPRFAPKQEVLLFLTGPDGGGYPQVMGVFQGAFRSIPGRGGTTRVNALSPQSLTVLRPDDGTSGPPGGAPALPLAGTFGDFLQRIRDLVRAQSAGSPP